MVLRTGSERDGLAPGKAGFGARVWAMGGPPAILDTFPHSPHLHTFPYTFPHSPHLELDVPVHDALQGWSGKVRDQRCGS